MDKKRLVWAFLSLVIALLTIWAVVSLSGSFSWELFSSYINNSNPIWLTASVLSMFGFIFFEGMAVRSITRSLGYKRNLLQNTTYGAADVYFSAITPSASGGQPASAYFMIKDGIPPSVVTVSLLFNLIMYNLALLIIGVTCLFVRFDMFLSFKPLSRFLILAGIAMLSVFAGMFFLLLRKEQILYRICDRLLYIPEKLRIVRHGDKLRAKMKITMEEYKVSARVVTGRPQLMAEALLWNILQRLAQFAVSGLVFLAAGKGLISAIEVTVNQCFVSMGSNTVPIPGSMGVADYIMIDGFEGIIGSAEATSMELLCRGLTFYICVLTGLVIVIIGYINRRIRDKRRTNARISAE